MSKLRDKIIQYKQCVSNGESVDLRQISDKKVLYMGV